MALTYTISGGSIASANQLAAKVWSKLLHEQVQNKSFFKNMVGRPKGGEGKPDASVVTKPIVEVTDLRKQAGDRVSVGLVRQLFTGGPSASARYNAGKVGGTQLVDGESTLSWNVVKVYLAHQRIGVRLEDLHSYQQKSPYDLKMTAKDALGNAFSGLMDDDIFFTIYSGYPAHVFREFGTSTLAGVTHPNRMFGANRSALSGVTVNDVMSTDIIERVAAWAKRENIAETDEGLLFIISPSDGYNLRRDSFFKDSQDRAGVRGDENRMFTGAFGRWGNIAVADSNKITTAIDYSSVTATAGSTISALNAETTNLPSGIAASSISMNILVGAQAVARAFGEEMYLATRKEDDYGNIAGFAAGAVWGDRRADFAATADSGTDGSAVNQSSALVYTYTDSPISNAPTTWS